MSRNKKGTKLNLRAEFKADTAKVLDAKPTEKPDDSVEAPVTESKPVSTTQEQPATTVSEIKKSPVKPVEVPKATERSPLKPLDPLKPTKTSPVKPLTVLTPTEKNQIGFQTEWDKVVSEIRENRKHTLTIAERVREKNRVLSQKISELRESLARAAAENKESNAAKENE
ncbi:uncharacterized protein DFL_003240 [Arthrobotrys flagrans]|uniref:Uncharacterized protein n=1 Tax=Arthrobotrys flagrans TaxID=97331 RepID=A0A437A196_ARTFL|nr:hypothetical protein DFL_003240 [Arthrobotrys flagrans]